MVAEKSGKNLILGVDFITNCRNKPNSQIVTLSTSLKDKGHCTEAAISILALRLVSVAKSPKVNRGYTG